MAREMFSLGVDITAALASLRKLEKETENMVRSNDQEVRKFGQTINAQAKNWTNVIRQLEGAPDAVREYYDKATDSQKEFIENLEYILRVVKMIDSAGLGDLDQLVPGTMVATPTGEPANASREEVDLIIDTELAALRLQELDELMERWGNNATGVLNRLSDLFKALGQSIYNDASVPVEKTIERIEKLMRTAGNIEELVQRLSEDSPGAGFISEMDYRGAIGQAESLVSSFREIAAESQALMNRLDMEEDIADPWFRASEAAFHYSNELTDLYDRYERGAVSAREFRTEVGRIQKELNRLSEVRFEHFEGLSFAIDANQIESDIDLVMDKVGDLQNSAGGFRIIGHEAERVFRIIGENTFRENTAFEDWAKIAMAWVKRVEKAHKNMREAMGRHLDMGDVGLEPTVDLQANAIQDQINQLAAFIHTTADKIEDDWKRSLIPDDQPISGNLDAQLEWLQAAGQITIDPDVANMVRYQADSFREQSVAVEDLRQELSDLSIMYSRGEITAEEFQKSLAKIGKRLGDIDKIAKSEAMSQLADPADYKMLEQSLLDTKDQIRALKDSGVDAFESIGKSAETILNRFFDDREMWSIDEEWLGEPFEEMRKVAEEQIKRVNAAYKAMIGGRTDYGVGETADEAADVDIERLTTRMIGGLQQVGETGREVINGLLARLDDIDDDDLRELDFDKWRKNLNSFIRDANKQLDNLGVAAEGTFARFGAGLIAGEIDLSKLETRLAEAYARASANASPEVADAMFAETITGLERLRREARDVSPLDLDKWRSDVNKFVADSSKKIDNFTLSLRNNGTTWAVLSRMNKNNLALLRTELEGLKASPIEELAHTAEYLEKELGDLEKQWAKIGDEVFNVDGNWADTDIHRYNEAMREDIERVRGELEGLKASYGERLATTSEGIVAPRERRATQVSIKQFEDELMAAWENAGTSGREKIEQWRIDLAKLAAAQWAKEFSDLDLSKWRTSVEKFIKYTRKELEDLGTGTTISGETNLGLKRAEEQFKRLDQLASQWLASSDDQIRAWGNDLQKALISAQVGLENNDESAKKFAASMNKIAGNTKKMQASVTEIEESGGLNRALNTQKAQLQVRQLDQTLRLMSKSNDPMARELADTLGKMGAKARQAFAGGEMTAAEFHDTMKKLNNEAGQMGRQLGVGVSRGANNANISLWKLGNTMDRLGAHGPGLVIDIVDSLKGIPPAAIAAAVGIGAIIAITTKLARVGVDAVKKLTKELVTLTKESLETSEQLEVTYLQLIGVFDGVEEIAAATLQDLLRMSVEIGTDLTGEFARVWLPVAESMEQVTEIAKIQQSLMAATGKSAEEVSRALRQMYSGRGEGLARQFAFTPGDIQRIHEYQEELGPLAGLIAGVNDQLQRTNRTFDAYADSFARARGTLEQYQKLLRMTIGEPVRNAAAEALEDIFNAVERNRGNIEDLATEFGKLIGTLIEFGGKKVAQVIDDLDYSKVQDILDAFERFADSVMETVDGFLENKDEITAFLESVATTVDGIHYALMEIGSELRWLGNTLGIIDPEGRLQFGIELSDIDNPDEAIDQLRSKLEDYTEGESVPVEISFVIGEKLLEESESAEEFIENVEKANEVVDEFIGKGYRGAGRYAVFGNKVDEELRNLYDTLTAIEEAETPEEMKELHEGLLLVNRTGKTGEMVIRAMGRQLAMSADSAEEFVRWMREVEPRNFLTGDPTEDFSTGLSDREWYQYYHSVQRATDALDENAKKQRDAAAAAEENTEAIEEQRDAIMELNAIQAQHDELIEEAIEAEEKLAEARKEHVQDINDWVEDVMDDYRKKLVEAEQKAQQDRIDEWTEYRRKIREMGIDFDIDVREEGIDLEQDEEDAWRDYRRDIIKAEEEFADDMVKIEEDLQDKLREIRQKADFDAAEAIRANDAVRLLEIRRREQFELMQARQDRDDKADNAKDKLEKERRDRWQALQWQLEDLRINYDRQLKELDRRLADERAKLERAREDNLADIDLAEERAFEKIRDWMDEQVKERIKANDRWLRDFDDTHQDALDIVERFNKIRIRLAIANGKAVAQEWIKAFTSTVGTINQMDLSDIMSGPYGDPYAGVDQDPRDGPYDTYNRPDRQELVAMAITAMQDAGWDGTAVHDQYLEFKSWTDRQIANWIEDTFDKDVPGYLLGTARVPYTGLYRLHEGEAVLKPQDAKAFRGLLGSGLSVADIVNGQSLMVSTLPVGGKTVYDNRNYARADVNLVDPNRLTPVQLAIIDDYIEEKLLRVL